MYILYLRCGKINKKTWRGRKKRSNSLESDGAVSQELLVKEPAEKNVQAGKNLEEKERLDEVRGRSHRRPGCTGYIGKEWSSPAESKRRQQQNHEDQEGVALVHRRPVFSRPAETPGTIYWSNWSQFTPVTVTLVCPG